MSHYTSKTPAPLIKGGRSRTMDELELDFDFSQVNLSKIFTLIHILYLEPGHSE